MDDENLASCEMNYKVHLKNGSLLSVQYFQDFYHEKAAHPTHKSFSTNIYLPESKIVRLTDIIDNRKVLANLLNEGKYKLGKYESKYEKDVLSSMYFYLGSTSSIANFEKADGIDFKTESDAYSYLTEDSLGIIIEVSYAAGGHISLEIKYSDIREMFKGNFGALVENYEVN